LAAKYMGMRAVYLEAGSGAERAVPVDIIEKTSRAANLFTIVGGGIRTAQQQQSALFLQMLLW
jgi:phosphoglycerol geranylgeranyltransferase